MIDIHNHLMHNVDDGSKDIEMSKSILKLCQEQGINIIFLTPHVNSSVSRASRSDHLRKYNELSEVAKKFNIKLFLGAEIYIPFRLPELQFINYTMGNNKILLVEFSQFSESPILDHVYNLMQKGFKVIIAHVERYLYLNEEEIIELKSIGAFFQVNSSSLINKKNRKIYKRANYFLNHNLIDFVATDSHNISSRKPQLKESYKYLLRKVGEKKARELVLFNQQKLFFD